MNFFVFVILGILKVTISMKVAISMKVRFLKKKLGELPYQQYPWSVIQTQLGFLL
jgi:hypothetical protein